MGKHGPCYHCGVTSTPLWRNGPPDKPVLCNACGSRWRTKGTLMNYTPQHARDAFEVEEFRFTKERKMAFKSKKKMPKVKWNICDDDEETEIGDYSQCFRKAVDEEMSNRSSSGSAVSYSESCAHVSGADVNEITGSFQSNVWDSIVPSRKRTCIIRPKLSSGEKVTKDALSCSKPSSVEKLTQDLHSIMYQQSSSLCASSEEDLLFENGAPMNSGEIGHGGMLIKRPDLENIEEESEASSLSAEKRLIVCSALPVPVHTHGFVSPNTCNGKLKSTQAILEPQKRVKVSQERDTILWERNSLLSFTDLKDIVSFEGFMKFLTSEEQHQLMKYLPSIDISMPPESTKCMFDSPQFVEALSFFQQLLREGVFDLTFSQMKPEASKNLKRLALSDLVKSNLVEHYYELCKGNKYDRSREKQPESGIYSIGSTTAHIKRPRINLDCSHNNEFPEAKIIVKSPRRPCITWSRNHLPARNIQQDLNGVSESLTNEENGHISPDGSCQSPRSRFASPLRRSGILDSLQFSDANTDQELLLDVRCNTSFPDAELLSGNWAQKPTGKNVCRPCGISENEGSVSCHSAVAFSSNHSINRH